MVVCFIAIKLFYISSLDSSRLLKNPRRTFRAGKKTITIIYRVTVHLCEDVYAVLPDWFFLRPLIKLKSLLTSRHGNAPLDEEYHPHDLDMLLVTLSKSQDSTIEGRSVTWLIMNVRIRWLQHVDSPQGLFSQAWTQSHCDHQISSLYSLIWCCQSWIYW